MSNKPATEQLVHKVRLLLIIFITGLVLSGLTAFPIQAELEPAHSYIQKHSIQNDLTRWLDIVYTGIQDTYFNYPFIGYGTDWLAFAHLVLAVAFVGPLRDPIKNIWVVQFGLMACIAVFPLALIAGEARGIPMWWRLIDCSFGLFGGIVLWRCHKKIILLSRQKEIIPITRGMDQSKI